MKKDLQDLAQRTRTDYAIEKIPFLACLNDREIAEFKGLIVEKQVMKNQLILHEEDTSNYLYFIFSGKVKIIQLSADGKEKMLAIHKRGDFFGEMAILDGGTAPATVIALENTRIGLISREAFHLHLLNNNKVLRGIIAMLCGRLRDAWSMMKVMSFADAEHRVRAVLKYMAEQFGVPGPEGTRIDMKLTHSDIGNFASLTRETATRMINRLEKAEEIEMTDRKFILLKPAFHKNTDLL
ncbi:MAG: Crp/Fnr family transcriptional regulator [Deltaproteobacteria bacterium]|jgi:CRP/FNR family cyclic AMP-dependent transcriptional regulator|nr:Crp/Fnr family transcriptional regulator [Deltaproteobacteria bacterium]